MIGKIISLRFVVGNFYEKTGSVQFPGNHHASKGSKILSRSPRLFTWQEAMKPGKCASMGVEIFVGF